MIIFSILIRGEVGGFGFDCHDLTVFTSSSIGNVLNGILFFMGLISFGICDLFGLGSLGCRIGKMLL